MERILDDLMNQRLAKLSPHQCQKSFLCPRCKAYIQRSLASVLGIVSEDLKVQIGLAGECKVLNCLRRLFDKGTGLYCNGRTQWDEIPRMFHRYRGFWRLSTYLKMNVAGPLYPHDGLQSVLVALAEHNWNYDLSLPITQADPMDQVAGELTDVAFTIVRVAEDHDDRTNGDPLLPQRWQEAADVEGGGRIVVDQKRAAKLIFEYMSKTVSPMAIGKIYKVRKRNDHAKMESFILY